MSMPPPSPLENNSDSRLKTIRWVVVGAFVLVLAMSLSAKDDSSSTPGTTPAAAQAPDTTLKSTSELTQGEKEHLFVQYVEQDHPGMNPTQVLKVVKTACDGLAAGDTIEDLANIIQNSSLSSSDQLEIAGLIGEGVRLICPDWAWKLNASN